MTENLLCISAVAQLLGVTKHRAYALARGGGLPGVVRLGRRQVRVQPAKLHEFIEGGGNRLDRGAQRGERVAAD